jgi:hypothetical protein
MTTPVTTDQRHRPQELLQRMSSEMYRRAYAKGLSLSAYLELYEDPSTGYNDGLDAFERLLQAAEIRTQSIPERGIYADAFDTFLKDDSTRALVPEWMTRQYRRAATGRDVSTRSLHTLGDFVAGGVQRPYADAGELREHSQLQPAVPLSELVARTEGITGRDYRALYMTESADEYRMKRVAEGTEIPTAKLTEGENVIRLRKFGRALEATYEMLRVMRLDKVAFHLMKLAVQAEVDKVAAAVSVMINGDGNSNVATVHALAGANGMDAAATAGTLSLRGWMRFKKKFKQPYLLTTVLMQEEPSTQLELLTVSNSNVQLVNGALGQITRINTFADGVRYGWLDEVPALKILGFDRRFALESITEIGANISEVDRYISKQTELLTFTEVQGFAILERAAIQVLDINGTAS